ncbi:MAG: hypothetical protein H8E29_00740 [Anaerolineales bacterium]|uniref:DUF8201 domain-containing protein n=1 Tax=Candidatus Desulfolinea nitratireducens TaxID=2841698 RepID=A0A8J6NHM7_9CHLR|nr:hypothetical protein [Candidatus Desulfolinea nitratireducens]
MIVSLFIWFYVTVLGYLYGSFFLIIYKKFTKADFSTVPASITVLLGIIAISSLATYLSLVIKLGLVANLLLGIGAVTIGVSGNYIRPVFRVQRSWRYTLIWGVIILGFISLLDSVTHMPSNYDTNLYHAQTIRWIESYRVVPGLGNLHGRLAFNSSWLLLHALFSFSFLEWGSFHALSGFFAFLMLCYFIRGSYNLLQGKNKLENWGATILVLLSFYIMGGYIKSPGTDLPAILLVWIIFILWVEFFDFDKGDEIFYLIITAVSLYAITVKLSVFPVSLLVGYIWAMLVKNKQWKTLIVLLTISGFILLPWLVRNIILSGYLIYPFAGINIFDFDWKIPVEEVRRVNYGILGFARLPGWGDAVDMPMREWFKLWYQNKTLNQKIVFQAAILSPLGLIVQLLIQRWSKHNKKTMPHYLFLFIALYTGVLFWFFQAPLFRFGYSFLISVTILGYLPIFIKIFNNFNKRFMNIITWLIVSGIFVYLGYFFIYTVRLETYNERIVFPSDYMESIVDPCPLGDLDIFCVRARGQCNYDAFPCVPHLLPNTKSRNGTLQGGFYSIP